MSNNIKWIKKSDGVYRLRGKNINHKIEADEVKDMGNGYFLLYKGTQKKLICVIGSCIITCIDWGEHEIARHECGQDRNRICTRFTWKVDGELKEIMIDWDGRVRISTTPYY